MSAKTTFDLDTNIGQVRLLIPDDKPGKTLFTDDKIRGFLAIEDGNVKRAAAQALETIATNLAMSLKYVQTNRLTVDGSKPANVCMARAKLLRDQVAPAAEDPDEDAWEFNMCNGGY